MIKHIVSGVFFFFLSLIELTAQPLFSNSGPEPKYTKADVVGTPLLFEKTTVLDSTISKDVLFSRALKWYAQSFNSSEAVIEMEDRPGGQIIGNGNFQNLLKTGLAKEEDKIKFTVETYFKNGKARIVLRDFKSDEFELITDAPAYKIKGMSKRTQNRLWRETQESVKKNAQLIINSFEKDMSNPTDTW